MAKYIIIAALIIILAFLQFRLWFEKNGVRETMQFKKAIASQTKANDQMKQRNSDLVAEVNNLKNSTQAVEERARDELGMIQKGEQFYQIVKPKNSVKD